jgi:RHS repeat-associated protein
MRRLDSAHMVTTDAGAPELAYVFAPIPGGAEHPLFRYDPTTGESVYYLQDSMGSVIGLVDQTTTQTATFEYDGFGGERSATGALASLPVASRGDYRFHGMWLDSGVGLYYVRARVYDAEVGRFLSNDPAEGRRAQPESFEGSRFALGSPTVVQDPTGRYGLPDTSVAGVGHTNLQMTAVASETRLLQTVVTEATAILSQAIINALLGEARRAARQGRRRGDSQPTFCERAAVLDASADLRSGPVFLLAYVCPEPIGALAFRGPLLVAWIRGAPFPGAPDFAHLATLRGMFGQPSIQVRLWDSNE